MRAQIDSYLTELAENDEFAGVVLVARGGDIILKKAYGPADYDKGIANTTDTRFQLASVAKTLTATAVMLLVERGQINLDAPISEYIADVPLAWRQITVTQLLSHTSGIPDYFSYDEFLTEKELTPDGVIAVAKTYPLDFAPGSQFEYGNTNYVLLGKIIERASGKTYGAFLREAIFDPLGMLATGREENSTPVAVGYSSFAERATIYPITNALGDGDLLSTVDDMYAFDRALYDDRLLTNESREKMFTAVGNNHYGLGWEVQDWKERRVLAHSGDINGFTGELLRLPDDDAVVIVLSNYGSFDSAGAAWAIAEMMFPG